MPMIYEYIGIYIYLYYKEHNPPHIHIERPGYKGTMTIKDCKPSKGMPTKIRKIAEAFIKKHRNELLKMWETKNGYLIED